MPTRCDLSLVVYLIDEIDFGPHINAHSGHSPDRRVHPWVNRAPQNILFNFISGFAQNLLHRGSSGSKTPSERFIIIKGKQYHQKTPETSAGEKYSKVLHNACNCSNSVAKSMQCIRENTYSVCSSNLICDSTVQLMYKTFNI